MAVTIETRVEGKRGCGFRKPGGMYLVAAGLSATCHKLPIETTTCPTCGAGIRPARGWTWVDGDVLAAQVPCETPQACRACPLCNGTLGHCGLLWVGERHYRTPEAFTAEALRMGVSRRVAAIPRGFQVGKTWVLLGHRKALSGPDGEPRPGIFHAFRPTAIEYVVREDDSQEHLESLSKRGIKLVRVIHAGESEDMFAPHAQAVEAG